MLKYDKQNEQPKIPKIQITLATKTLLIFKFYDQIWLKNEIFKADGDSLLNVVARTFSCILTTKRMSER